MFGFGKRKSKEEAEQALEDLRHFEPEEFVDTLFEQ